MDLFVLHGLDLQENSKAYNTDMNVPLHNSHIIRVCLKASISALDTTPLTADDDQISQFVRAKEL
jgi:hypothetical protein